MAGPSALVFAALSAVVVLFHLSAIAGAPVGHLTMAGRWPGRLPPAARALSAVSASLTAGVAGIAAVHGGLVTAALPGWTVWVPVGFAALATLANAATPSAPERRLWLPVTLVLLGAAVGLAVG